MKVVSLSQREAKLSDYVDLVKAGVTVLVKEGDEVVAELRPARRKAPGDILEDVLDTLADSGEITRAALPKGNWTWRARGLGLAPGTAQTILDEIRDDR